MKYTILFLLLCLPCVVGWDYRSVTVAVDEPPADTYLFSWDMETATALLDSGNGSVVGVPKSDDVTLSTDYAVSPTQSLRAPTGYDYYAFTDSTVFNPVQGKVTFYAYNNATNVGDIIVLKIGSSGVDDLTIKHLATDTVQGIFSTTTGSIYMMATASSMIANQWNKCVLTWDTTSGSTLWSWAINDIASGSGSDDDVWDSGSLVEYAQVGIINGVTPLMPIYIDDVRIE